MNRTVVHKFLRRAPRRADPVDQEGIYNIRGHNDAETTSRTDADALAGE